MSTTDLNPYQIGTKLTVTDIASAPEGSWVVRENMLFLRAKEGHSIVSLTPIEDSTPVVTNKTPDKYTLIYAGPFNAEKSTAVASALNAL